MCYKLIKTGDYIERKLVSKIKVDLQKRQKKGGQSAQRIGRIRDEKENKYIKEISEMIINSFLKNNHTVYECDNIIIAGPGELKKKVMETPLVEQYYKNNILDVVSTQELTDTTILTIPFLESSQENDLKIVKNLIDNADEKLVFGKKIIKNIENNQLEYIFLDKNLDEEYINSIKSKCSDKCKIKILNLYENVYISEIGVKYY
jgi:peptide subunit release factor 1 (eRF1)